MTRINLGIDPRELPNKLLLAEHREITRIPNAVSSGRAKLGDQLSKFSLGTGHVRFFYYRLQYLWLRYEGLLKECQRRGFNVTDKSSAFTSSRFPPECWNEYVPTMRDRNLVLERIRSKGFELKEV